MRILSCFFILIFAAGVISCTGDDETITINTKQCYNGTTVNVTEGEKCPTPPPPTMGNGDTSGGDAGGGDDGSTGGECSLDAIGKAPFDGSSTDDVICGDSDNNTINALGGEDVVRARAGNDTVDGGTGNDELYGEAGDDILTGGEDEDVIDGGPGNDTLTGSEGRDTLIGGDGIDTVKYVGTEDEKPLVGISGDDYTPHDLTISLADGYSDDEYGDRDTYVDIENVITGPGNDKITGNGKPNRIDGGSGQLARTSDDSRLLDGGAGIDTLVVGEPTVLDGDTGPENANFENLEVREDATGPINLTGNAGNNVLKGGDGGGILDGMGGDDRLVGGAVRDVLRGGSGENEYIGGAGGDCFEITIENPVMTDRIRDFGEGDTVRVAGSIPDSFKRSDRPDPVIETNLRIEAKPGKIVIVEFQAGGDDGKVFGERGTLATVTGLGPLPEGDDTTVVAGTTCSL